MQTLFCAFLIYIAVMFAVVYFRPKTMYNSETKEHRSFGTSGDATLFPTWLCAAVVAIFSYVVSLFVCSPHYTLLSSTVPIVSDAPVNNMVHIPSRRASIGGVNQQSHTPIFATLHNSYQQQVNHPQHTQNSQHQNHSHTGHHKGNQYPHHHPHQHLRQSHPPMHHYHTNPPQVQNARVHQSRVWKHAMQ